jgi:hypothetical protein
MSQPASRVIGIIRFSESDLGVDLRVGADDSTLGALLASLVAARPQRTFPHGSRFEPAAVRLSRRGTRRFLTANLSALREELEREYVALSAG